MDEDLERLREQLKDRRLDILADATGISSQTIANIRDGKNTNPKIQTLIKLKEYFDNAK